MKARSPELVPISIVPRNAAKKNCFGLIQAKNACRLWSGGFDVLPAAASDNSCIDVLRSAAVTGDAFDIEYRDRQTPSCRRGAPVAAAIRGGREYRGAVRNPAEKDGKRVNQNLSPRGNWRVFWGACVEKEGLSIRSVRIRIRGWY